MPSIYSSPTTPERVARHIEVLAPHAEPVVVVMGPRLRCGSIDYDALEYFIGGLSVLRRAITFRVSGMVAGPEEFVERIAPALGHRFEVFGASPEERVRRLNKLDDHERDAGSLLGAHALWVWPLTYEIESGAVDNEMIIIAQELEVPVFLFMPEAYDLEVLELA